MLSVFCVEQLDWPSPDLIRHLQDEQQHRPTSVPADLANVAEKQHVHRSHVGVISGRLHTYGHTVLYGGGEVPYGQMYVGEKK